MKSVLLIFLLALAITSCKKETALGGALRVTFKPRHQYQYQNINVIVTT